MHEPIYQLKLERMVLDQKGILIGAAYGDSGIWMSLANLYRFAVSDHAPLRSYIRNTYRPDGGRRPDPVIVAHGGRSGCDARASGLAGD